MSGNDLVLQVACTKYVKNSSEMKIVDGGCCRNMSLLRLCISELSEIKMFSQS